MKIHLRAYNTQYLCAEEGGGSVVLANRTDPHEWEVFIMEKVGGRAENDIYTGDQVTLGVQALNYVTAVHGGGFEVFTRRQHDRRRPWQTFTVRVVKEENCFVIPDGVVKPGCWITLQTSNGGYLCAEEGGGREVNASRLQASFWEMFRVEEVSYDVGRGFEVFLAAARRRKEIIDAALRAAEQAAR